MPKPTTTPPDENPSEGEDVTHWRKRARATFTASDPKVLHDIRELAAENLRSPSAEIELAIRNWLKMKKREKKDRDTTDN